MPQHAPQQDDGHHALRWFGRGAAAVISMPAAVLAATFVGFAGIARESGLTLGETVLSTATMWALPNQLVLVGAIAADAALLTAAAAVTLSAIRLLPMVVAWVPVIRDENTPRWHLVLLSHFVAVTTWVFAMGKLPELPRRVRVPFFAGFAVSLALGNICIVALAYMAIGKLPVMLAGALAFLTPIYFLLSLWATGRRVSDKLAMLFGLLLGPVFFLAMPGLDLLWTGLVGGTAAYLIGRFAWRGGQ